MGTSPLRKMQRHGMYSRQWMKPRYHKLNYKDLALANIMSTTLGMMTVRSLLKAKGGALTIGNKIHSTLEELGHIIKGDK